MTILIKLIHSLTSNRRKVVNIRYYQTCYKKQLPDEIGDTITCNHVNSGLCYVNSGENDLNIILHRKEEFYKVLTHEMLHLYDVIPFDELVQKEYERMFNGIKHINANEALVELNAMIINCIIINQIHNIPFNVLINREHNWSNHQMKKMKAHFNMKGINTEKERVKWKESTSAFSYYIIKTILLNKIMKKTNGYVNEKIIEKYNLAMTTNDVENPKLT
jgi:hypothetical protein